MTNVIKFHSFNKHDFSEMLVGQALVYEGKLYIKTHFHMGRNCVSVETGVMGWFSGNIPVEPVDLEIIVK